MRATLKMFIAIVVVFLAGCAVSPEMHVRSMLEKTDASMTAGDLAGAHGFIASAFDTPGQQAQITKFFTEKPQRRDIYVKVMAYHIDLQMVAPEQAAAALRHINQSEHLLYISSHDARVLREKLVARAQQGNTSNTIGFMLRDELHGLGLDSPKHKEIILKRTLATANGSMDASNRQTAALLAYASNPTTSSAHKKLIEKSLDQTPITKNEMELYVRPVFPKYAESRIKNMTLNAALVYSGGDRLAREDLLDTVRGKIRGVEWLPYGSTGATVVKVERLRHNEREERPRVETIRYTRSQAYSVSREMPEKSSYSYKLAKSAVTIEYGYEVTVLVNGKVTHNQIVRGTERSERTHCSDAVIHMPGGGLRPARNEANYDMKRRCSSSGSASIPELRRRIDNKIADAILAAPTITRIHHLNS